jgi:hypothetical protein
MQVKKETGTSKDEMIPLNIFFQVKKFNISEKCFSPVPKKNDVKTGFATILQILFLIVFFFQKLNALYT